MAKNYRITFSIYSADAGRLEVEHFIAAPNQPRAVWRALASIARDEANEPHPSALERVELHSVEEV